MYIRITAMAGAKKEKITKEKSDRYTIAVREPAERNLANKRILEIVAGEYGLPVGKIRMISGHQSSHKILSVNIEG